MKRMTNQSTLRCCQDVWRPRAALLALAFCTVFVGVGAASAWARRPAQEAATAAAAAAQEPQQTAQLASILAEFNHGCGYMEMFEYAKAALAFNQVVEAAPDWTAARFNQGLAYLNMAGENKEAKRLGSTKEMIETAIATFQDVLQRDPQHWSTLYCLGVVYAYQGDDEQSLAFFEKVYRHDPDDLFVAYNYAKALKNLDRSQDAMPVLERIVERDRGFVSAVSLLSQVYMRSRRTADAKALSERHRALIKDELSVGSFAVSEKYGMSGKYYLVIGADGLPLPPRRPAPRARVVFLPEPQPLGDASQAWDWSGGHIRLPGVAVADVDQDDDLDLLLTGQGPRGAARVWTNDGQGKFMPGAIVADQVACPSFGDIDNDGDVDLWLGRAGNDQLFLNDGRGQFSPSLASGIAGPDVLTALTQLADLDSDGDLDLLAFRAGGGDVPPAPASAPPAPSSIWFNNADGTFADRAAALSLQCADTRIASVTYDDFDNDFDLDLIVFPAGAAPVAWVNLRVGDFRWLTGADTGLQVPVATSATTGDPDQDGDRDLLVFTPDGVRLFLNTGRFAFEESTEFAAAFGRLCGTGGQFADLDNDGDLDIVIADATRADGSRGPALLLNTSPEFGFVNVLDLDPGNLFDALRTDGDASCVAADFTGDGRCDVLLAPVGQPPLLIENGTAGGHWIQLDLAGARPQDPVARCSQSAIGARVEVRTGTHFQQYVLGGSAGPVASQPLRIHAGLGPHAKIDWLRIVWPDAVLQGEVEMAADRLVNMEELSRKESSCPYLFVWNGARFAFVSDFGGVGGLGYYLGHGRYAPPDPTEYLPLPELKPLEGHYVLQALTPLEEITYFDEAKLVAVDHPQGTQVYPHEMAAISAAPPDFELFCVRDVLQPVRAVDDRGEDVTQALRTVDRCYAGATQPDRRFLGLAEPHYVELDFGNQLARIDMAARMILFLQGWVEYAYSSTNYAASQAGKRAEAPTIEVWRDEGWVTLGREVGYPAGISHMMTIDLTGKLSPTDQRIRVSSNMELYWDQVFLAPHVGGAELRIQEVAAREADLHFRGYPREYSPDGRRPNLSDYENLDRNVGWKLMSGDYTRFGDVRPLLEQADDCFVITSHGEEITLRFAVDDFAPVPPGYVRSLLLKTDSYCKDMDLYTAFPDTVEPLPFHGMSGYPYESHERYPDTEATRRYRETYNTRRIEGR